MSFRARFDTLPPPLFGVFILPSGMCKGFVTVTLGFVLAQHGVGIAVISGLVGLRLLPETWSFAAGPLIDSTLTPVRWYLISVATLALCTVAIAFTPMQGGESALLALLCLATGVTAVLSTSAAAAVMALTTTGAVRGACAGWRETGNLGGIGLGGGAGLWLAEHAGGLPVSALTLAALYVLCLGPLLLLRVPTAPRGAIVRVAAGEAVRALWKLLRTRGGVLAVVAVVLPAGLGAAPNLLPAVASEWHASADLVAAVTGILSGLATIPGCITSGYLCDRFPRLTVYMGCALVAAVGEGLMALAPHTPWAFAGVVLLTSAFTGLAYGSVTAVIFDRLGRVGAATINGVLASLANVPVVLVTMLLGIVQIRHGSVGMLGVEAALGVLSVAAYAVLVTVWREAPQVTGGIEAAGLT